MALSTAATLGSVTFHGWRGWVGSNQNVVDVFSRIGQSGSGSEITHTRSSPVSISAWSAHSSASAAITQLGSIEALQGTTVALTDPFSRSLSKVRVTEAHGNISAGKGNEITSNVPMTHLVKCELTIELLP